MTNPLRNLNNYKIYLASGSPRRKELLSRLNITFEVPLTVNVDETYPIDMSAENVASYLSRLKAEAYRPIIEKDTLIITADTVVINDGELLGKPATEQDAVSMLQALSGRSHKVITGVTISTADKQSTFSVETEVEFAQIEQYEIEWYVKTYLPLDKAGAYGIQEWIGCIGVKNINGSFYNVMGLPLHRLYCELKKF